MILVILLGLSMVGGITLGGVLETASPVEASGNPVPTPPVTAAVKELPNSQSAWSPDWVSQLHSAAECASPCSGGVLCQMKPVKCTSGVTCVPGVGSELLGVEERWSIRLSAVQERGPTGERLNPCATGRDFWLCRDGVCVAQSDACSNTNPVGASRAGLVVTGAELATEKVVLEVREGGAEGALLAMTRPLPPLQRGGLCKGFVVPASGGAIHQVSFFVLPP